MLSDTTFEKFTSRTITNTEALLENLSEARRRGWSVDGEEAEDGVRCIGAPVFDFRHKPIAAVSISRAIDGDRPFDEETAARHLLNTVNEISKRMGCTVDVRTLIGASARTASAKKASLTS
jgi:DNA-binding IclR family transcriptional regulator